MKITGILFSRSMVLALQAGTKTQTRRVLKRPEFYGCPTGDCPHWNQTDCDAAMAKACPYGLAGDLIYVKETCIPASRNDGRVLYAARYEDPQLAAIGVARGGWKPSIMMAQDEARFWYELREVRWQRLAAITEEDAKAEGIEPAADGSYVSAYADLWNRLNSGFKPVKDLYGKTWKVDHYVSHPWGGRDANLTHKGLNAYVRPNPFVYALTFAPAAAPGTTAAPTTQENA